MEGMGGNVSVLVIDEIAGIRRQIAENLQTVGYDPRCTGLSKASQLVAQEPYHAVFINAELVPPSTLRQWGMTIYDKNPEARVCIYYPNSPRGLERIQWAKHPARPYYFRTGCPDLSDPVVLLERMNLMGAQP